MPTPRLSESTVEAAALDWFHALGYATLHGPDLAFGEPAAERADPNFRDVVLERRLRCALADLNPELPAQALDEAYRKLTQLAGPSLVARNRDFHRFLVNGVAVEYARDDGAIAGGMVRVLDFDTPANNDWLAVNQFTVIEDRHQRRPDLVVFVNGLPLAVIELKSAVSENATIWTAFQQLQTYKAQIPSLFAYNALLVVSDGIHARVGSLTATAERFMPWRTIDGEALAPAVMPQLQVLLQGLFDKHRLLDLIRYFTVFEDAGAGPVTKKIAAYHQFHAVNRALETTIRAVASPQDHRAGVVWHTQGSGKSLTMAFYAGRLVLAPTLENPTVVVLTDRNDLDNQLFGTFSRCQDLLRQPPEQAQDREHLRVLLDRSSGGVVFTTIQKFLPAAGERLPALSQRKNIVVIADEAHRSQYDFVDGFARHLHDALPHAACIGFTGTPIDSLDKSTRGIFGDYISVYDIQRAVEDHAIVPIYYESRLARISLDEGERLRLDAEYEAATEQEEVEHRDRLRTKWAALEVVVGTESRLRLVAEDLVRHFEARQEALRGKAMVVCMSRRICVALYDEIVRLRPDWHSPDDNAGALKVVMTGSAADGPDWQPHIGDKRRRELLDERFKNPADPFQIAIVRDMWLTGFDVPCLHTMYVDKPMRGHGLMQAIARVNRVFGDKPGGLIVDYLGIAHELKAALASYTESGGRGRAAIPQEDAVNLMWQKYEVCLGILHGFDWSAWSAGPEPRRLQILADAQEFILSSDPKDGLRRFLNAVAELSRAFALAVPHEKALRIRDDVAFFQYLRSVMAKSGVQRQPPDAALDQAVRQIISRAVVPGGVVDIFAAAGLQKPEISVLSEEFLAELRAMPQKNLAVEMLRKLLHGEIQTRSRRNIVQYKLFSELLANTIRQYQNRAVLAAQVIEELLALARQVRDAARRGEDLGLTEDELAFYDALETNDSAVKVLGDETLKHIARELVETVRRNTKIDWNERESVRARLRVLIKRILRKYGYPPDKQEKATETVLEQAKELSSDWLITAPTL